MKRNEKILYEIKLQYTPPIGGQHTVFVAGSFSDWQPKKMEHDNGNYTINLKLSAGNYPYKFIVDEQWITDANAKEFEDDRQGGCNSILVVENDDTPLFLVPIYFKPTSKNMKTVTVAGSFNNWLDVTEFLLKQDNGTFAATLLLPLGNYEYKFRLNNEVWQEDLLNSQNIDDGKGGKNSILQVTEKLKQYDGSQDNIFTYNLIDEFYPLGENINNDLSRFACKTYRSNVDSVFLILSGTKHKMSIFFSDEWYDYYSIIIPKSPENTFKILFQKNAKERLLKDEDSFVFKRRNSKLNWLQNGVIYQIFCDRFCNGDTKLNPKFDEWFYDPEKNPLSPAVRNSKHYLERNWNNNTILKDHPNRYNTFYGGDLAGVLQKLPYLKDLGITCLYFNPLVKAVSNHKYDTIDYLQVDAHFGGNLLFEKLVKKCHSLGISIILDFAFNHVGTGFFAFQDCLKNGEKSKYYNWFDWHKWPLPKEITENFIAAEYYQCWWGHSTLPDLNFDLKRKHPAENYIHDVKDALVNEPMVNYLMRVAEFWIKEMDIDGFRLDVPNEVPFWFWQMFKEKVKSLKDSAYLVGEIWHNAREWTGTYFDAVMNYSFFREPVLQFFALQNWNRKKFIQTVMKGMHTYGFHDLSLMMNLISSHDTYRFLQACNGNIDKLKLALIFEFCWIGVPHIYYGDEVGLQGGNDPDNRRPMNWNYSSQPELQDIHDFLKQLIKLRRANPELVFGDVKVKEIQSRIVYFTRRLKSATIHVLLNNNQQSAEIDLNLDIELIDMMSSKKSNEFFGTEKIFIKRFSAKILKEYHQ